MKHLHTVLIALLAIPLDAEVGFNRDIRPILSDKCFSCHGMDQQKAGLRLDLAETALKGGKSGKPAIVPGKPDESLILYRVTHPGEDRMPPPEKDSIEPLDNQ